MNTTATAAPSTATEPEARFSCGETLRYIGPDAEHPVNRTILAPSGAHADLVDFRSYRGFGKAEIMTSRGSRIVAVEHLARVEG